ncbi:hypothetical protein BCR44DRAFT_1440885 [Catenaria anguillulae PL171]|uniref:Uncharacterized protein n=1 Tax=Catenaria anguillulae PL171 TaxID=765915 RepID=A0A1Y2HC59_9FUNG|nr:hypothetical protein BCR44DRAFT_1440885 [Catenaria anguillulae PL171]
MRRRPAVVWETIRQREQQSEAVEWWVRAIQGERVEEVETKVLDEAEGDKVGLALEAAIG